MFLALPTAIDGANSDDSFEDYERRTNKSISRTPSPSKQVSPRKKRNKLSFRKMNRLSPMNLSHRKTKMSKRTVSSVRCTLEIRALKHTLRKLPKAFATLWAFKTDRNETTRINPLPLVYVTFIYAQILANKFFPTFFKN